jgi:hypothetical protein
MTLCLTGTLFSFKPARVGIGQRLHLFQTSPKPFGSGNFSKCCSDKDVKGTGWVNQANNCQHKPTNPSVTNRFGARSLEPKQCANPQNQPLTVVAELDVVCTTLKAYRISSTVL